MRSANKGMYSTSGNSHLFCGGSAKKPPITSGGDASVMWVNRINTVMKNGISILQGILALFSLRLPFVEQETLLFIYFIALVLASLVSIKLNKKHPFKASSLFVFGVFIGIITDIILFPTIDGGYERNLFPLEIAIHTIISSAISFSIAGVWYFKYVKNRSST